MIAKGPSWRWWPRLYRSVTRGAPYRFVIWWGYWYMFFGGKVK